jgi:hypothetical protein
MSTGADAGRGIMRRKTCEFETYVPASKLLEV